MKSPRLWHLPFLALTLSAFFNLSPLLTQAAASDFFLHSSTADFLDNTSPTATAAKFKDSASINFAGGNSWKEIGTWRAAPALSAGNLTSLNPVHVWLGLKNSDDQGTQFDLQAELYRDGTLVAKGLTRCITGVTRNPDKAKEVTVPFDPFTPVALNGTTEVLSLRILTRIGTNADGSKCPGHSNAVGLRLYYDAVSRSSRFGATFGSPTPSLLVRITSPTPDSVVQRPTIFVFGQVNAPAGIQMVTVNGIEAQANEGVFGTVIPLGLGANLITATLVDLAGNSISDSITVIRQDLAAPDFLGMWSALKDSLRMGDIETALNFIMVQSRERYRGIFNALGAQLSEIDLILTDITPVAIRQDDAEFEMFRGGRSFHILFVRDDDGIWRLATF